MLDAAEPALVLAPMEGITDAPMRALQGATGVFRYCISEFLRVAGVPLTPRVFYRDVQELRTNCRTSTGLPVQVQLLGGHPERVALSAVEACRLGAPGIDLNFGCPAPTVNNHDGGAALLRHPKRIKEIVAEVRAAVPVDIPVSAKLRLGWDDPSAVHENSAMAAEGGAAWITIHARTRAQGYAPPVDWRPIGQVRERLGIPIVANGDLWTLDAFRRCRDATGCIHYMLGRSALANPAVPFQIARELGVAGLPEGVETEWIPLLQALVRHSLACGLTVPRLTLARLKQWLSLASKFGEFDRFDEVKRLATQEELFAVL
jgi:tRNA-dihydrouridine synthase C